MANLYFLFICVLMLIGTYATSVFESPLSPYSTLAPLIVVLAITMAKEGAEDWKRHTGDRVTNSRRAPVVAPDGSEQEVLWRDIRVGSIVRVCNREEVPADLIVLASSEDKGICYVETSNIDGETNLKLKESVGLPVSLVAETASAAAGGSAGGAAHKAPLLAAAAALRGELTYEQPNDRIHTFTGTLVLAPEGLVLGVDARSMLLRGCTLRNTGWVLGLVAYTGRESKVMKKSGGARFKMSAVEQVMNKCILLIFGAQALLCTIATVAEVVWRGERAGQTPYLGSDSAAYVIPVWLANWFTFLLLFNNFIPISLYVTVELVNYAQAFLVGQDPQMYDADTDTPARARTSTLNTDLGQIQYVFSDKTGTLTRNIMEFKRCSVGGRTHGRYAMDGAPPVAVVPEVYTAPIVAAVPAPPGGSEGGSRLPGVAGEGGSSSSSSSSGGAGEGASSPDDATPRSFAENRVYAYTSSQGVGPPPCKYGLDDPALVALVRGQGNPHLDPAVAGRRGYGLWWHNSDPSLPPRPRLGGEVRGPASSLVEYSEGDAHALEAFFTCMAVCHTVVPEAEPGGGILYQAESPDEAALVGTAADLGISFVERHADRIVLKRETAYRGHGPERAREARLEWVMHGVHAFNSTRKRMAVVCTAPDGRRMIMVKGADNVMLARAAAPEGEGGAAERQALLEHLKEFGEQGLRTLVMGQRVMEEGEFQAWQAKFSAARVALQDREGALSAVAEEYEHSLALLGASGVEDKLQDDVPSTIEDMRRAGIRVWVLTGDKVETAINIGFSARLLDDKMRQILVDAEGLEELRLQLADLERKLAVRHAPAPPSWGEYLGLAPSTLAQQQAAQHLLREPGYSNPALIVTGPALNRVLGDPEAQRSLLNIAMACKSVLACRTSPAQKARIVEMVKTGIHPSPITLAIGDGANDVGMIMKADVGVGISGREGLQAANSADFSIAQFKFLRRLLLVHGRWDYRRMSKVVLYSFYKNVVITLTLFFFNALASFSGTSLYQSTIYAVYNFVLGLPIIAVGILDQDLKER